MRPRTSSIVLAATVAATVTAGAQAAPLTVEQAGRATGATPQKLAPRTGLSRAQLARYVAGAQSVGGLGPSALALTLRRPELIAAVPVVAQRGITAAARANPIPARGCRTTESYIWFKSVAGVALWRFALAKYWCWNRNTRRVNSKPNIRVKVHIKQAASISGWDYDGTVVDEREVG